MIKIAAILLFLLFLVSCQNPFAHPWDNEYILDADQIVLPDTARIFQSMQIKVQITLDTSNHHYKGKYLKTTPDGYLIVLIGVIEDTREPDVDQTPRSEWHSFNLIPFKRGQVIVEGNCINSVNVIDSVYVE